MFHQLDPSDFRRAQPLFEAGGPGLEIHLAPQAALAGIVPANVYVNDPSDPGAALVRIGYRFYLAGATGDEGFQRGLRCLFLDEVYPQALETGRSAYVLHYAPGGWQAPIEAMLEGRHPALVGRRYYAFQGPVQEWRSLLPPGFEVRPVDRSLLEDGQLQNLDRVREEVLSESPSVEHYLAHRFGVCAVAAGSAIAGLCLSEYNWQDRCEVGIETFEDYQRQGLATVTASALIEKALSAGWAAGRVRHIGWHCYVTNAGSIATANRVGFKKVREYPAYYAWFDDVANLAVNGNIRFQQGRYSEAIGWYERALQSSRAPAWAHLNAACACAMAGDEERALGHLRRALEGGFADPETVRGLHSLESLHGTPGWQALLAGR